MSKIAVVPLILLLKFSSVSWSETVNLPAQSATQPTKQQVDSLNQLAFTYLGYDSLNTAHYASQAIDMANKIDYQEGVSDAYYAIGWVTMVFGHNSKATELFNKVLEISKKAHYAKGKANAFNGLGDANRNMGNYTASLENHLMSLKLREEMNDKPRVASSLNNIGIIYYDQKDYEKALEYYTRSLELRKEIGDQRQIAVSYNNIGIVHVARGEIQEALEYYQSCLEINVAMSNQADVARNYHNIGVLYLDHQIDTDLGLNYLLKSLEIYEELGDKGSMTYPLIGIGGAYYKLNDLTKAKRYIMEGIKLSEEAQLLSNVNDGLKILSDIEEKTGNYKAAYETHKRFKALSDQLVNEAQTKTLALREAEYKFQKEKDQMELEKVAITEELKRERFVQYAAFGGVLILSILLFILFQFYKVKRKSNRILISKNAEIQKHRDELVKLNSAKTRFFSIISHDLRSPVNSLFGLLDLVRFHLHDKYKAESDQELNDLIGHFKKAGTQLTILLNNLIAWALKEEGMMPYRPEPLNVYECLKENHTIHELNTLSKQIELRMKADEDIKVWADQNSLMTILRNLTSNAIKFTPAGGSVSLLAERKGDYVVIEIEDSGVGIEEEKLRNLFDIDEKKTTRGTEGERGTGLGLNLVHDFIKMNKGSIQVFSRIGIGTTFKIELPAYVGAEDRVSIPT